MNKLTFFDLEYANTQNQSICQMGAVCLDYATWHRLYPDINLYINPDDNFNEYCIGIHHITPDRVENCPTFDQVWGKLTDYFEDAVVVGHNVANSDLIALTRTLQRYNIQGWHFRYLDTEQLARHYIPAYAVSGYKLSCLCAYFGIKMGAEHNALDDARAAYRLLEAMLQRYDIPLETHIHTFNLRRNRTFARYISNLTVRRDLCHFWGVLCGIAADGTITKDEVDYLRSWRDRYATYVRHSQLAAIVAILDDILEDNIVTGAEMDDLRDQIEEYLSQASCHDSTLAMQQLRGLLVGIGRDGRVDLTECHRLYDWVYGNARLAMQAPYDRLYALAQRLLQGQTITPAQSRQMLSLMEQALDPLAELSTRVYNVCGRHICLTGKFERGTHSEVSAILRRAGAIVDRYICNATEILVRGDADANAYLYGQHPHAVVRALTLRDQGQRICIIKEHDLDLLLPTES